MSPWREKPGGFGGAGGYGADNAWLGSAKRQSLFRAAAPAVPWATSRPAAARVQQPAAAPAPVPHQPAQPAASQQQPSPPTSAQQQPAKPASLFSLTPAPAAGADIWGRTPEQIRTEHEREKRVLWEMDQIRRRQGLPLNRAGYNPNVHGEDHPWNPAFKGFS